MEKRNLIVFSIEHMDLAILVNSIKRKWKEVKWKLLRWFLLFSLLLSFLSFSLNFIKSMENQSMLGLLLRFIIILGWRNLIIESLSLLMLRMHNLFLSLNINFSHIRKSSLKLILSGKLDWIFVVFIMHLIKVLVRL